MLTLIAESKTMSSYEDPIKSDFLETHLPVFENFADNIMENIAGLTPATISEILGVSMSLAVKTRQYAYDFPHKATGYDAFKGFTGDVYRSLDVKTLPEAAVSLAADTLRIISSIYGILRPSDIIKPYRSEFNKEICPGAQTPIKLFKPKVTVEIVNMIKENKISDIINLLPADAEKSLDFKIIRAFAPVHKILFQYISSDGTLKTPIAKRLKELRGLMCRTILINKIESFEELKKTESEHFIFSPVDSKPGLPVFIVTE